MIFAQPDINQIPGRLGISFVASRIAFDMENQTVLVWHQQNDTIQLIEKLGLEAGPVFLGFSFEPIIPCNSVWRPTSLFEHPLKITKKFHRFLKGQGFQHW